MEKQSPRKKKSLNLESIKSDFVTVASHQLRTPISSIRWSLDTVLQDPEERLSDKQKEVIEEAYESNKMMVKIVNDLLRVARMEEKGIKPSPEQVSVTSIIKLVVKQYQPFAKASNTNIKVKIEPRLPKAYIDPLNLEFVLDGLLDNAVRYSKQQGVITVTAKNLKSFIEISVRDNGIGIPENQHHLVFSKFFRANNARTVQTEGMGLDLYMIKKVIAASGGSIEFMSSPEDGTIFTFQIPKTKKQIDQSNIKEYKNGVDDNLDKLHREREFVSITVHELKAPLGTAKWSLELLQSKRPGPLTDDQSELIERLYRGNERLLVLVRDLLNLSKLQDGKFKVDIKPIAVNQIIDDSITTFSDEAAAKSITVKKKIGKLPKVSADQIRITQVLTNLVSNAIKYTKSNGHVTITAKKVTAANLKKIDSKLTTSDIQFAENKKGYVVISVTDTGIGISKADQKKMFSKFFRSKSALDSGKEGTGLGLYITKSIVNLHRGDIWFESTPGKGSTFSFSIPVH